jgi:two-component system, NarL family, sensor kinase
MKPASLLFLIIALAVAPSAIDAQTWWAQRRDSLLKVLAHARADTDKVWTLERMAEVYGDTPLKDSTLYYINSFGQLSQKLNYPKGMAGCLSMKAWFYAYKRFDTDTGIALDLQALQLAKKANLTRMVGQIYNNTAAIYNERKEDHTTALDYYLKGLAIFEQLRDSSLMAMAYGNIGTLYSALKEYEKSYTYSLEGVMIYRSLNKVNWARSGMLGISSALIALKRYDTALIVLKDAKRIADQLNDLDYHEMILVDMITIYIKTLQLPLLRQTAMDLSLISRPTATEGMYTVWAGLSDYYFYKRDYRTASVYNDSLIKETLANSALDPLASAYERKARIALAQGRLDDHDRNTELHDSIADLLLSDKILKNTQELETRYSLDKEKAQIKSLNDEKKIDTLVLREHRWTIWALSGLLVVFAILTSLFYSINRQKKRLLLSEAALQQQKIAELEKERQLLATRSVLLGQDEERKRLAKDLHDGLGGILSVAKYSFGNMKQNLVITAENAEAFDKGMGYLDKSIRELRRVAHNMMPEALIEFGLDTALKDYCNSIAGSGVIGITYQSFEMTDDSIPPASASVIYRIIQELINNILKHAHATTAAIQLVRRKDALSITVEDNGSGFDIGILKTSDGIGFLNLRNRVSYLEGTIDIQTAPGLGTYVSIEIPVNNSTVI